MNESEPLARPALQPDEGGEAEIESLQLLELRHRIKNLLGIVQAVANQTLRSGRTIEEARVALDGRLGAMGQSVDMLLQTGWAAGDLRQLIRQALMDGDERIALRGEDVVLGPDAVMALTLVFHELESNAIKYGALSHDDGRVEIVWSLSPGTDGEWLELEWAEHDGPPCIPPSRKGFGSKMMAKLIGGRLRGSAEAEYRADGLRWRLSAPVAALAPS
jgi:two-component sensor histidine kinase